MTDSKPDFTTDQDVEFKNYILYILSNDMNSRKALDILRKNAEFEHEVWIQDCDKLPRPLPPWLTGVPTLVPRSESMAYKGTQCLDYIQKLTSMPRGCGPQDSGFYSFEDGTPCVQENHYEAPQTDMPEMMMTDDKLSPSSLEQYMKMRESQNSQFQEQPNAKAMVVR